MKKVILITAMMTLAGCATMPSVPEALRAPAGEKLSLELLASGVQVYECAAGADAGKYEWKFRGPEATLTDRDGRPMGTHYGGPTWKALDGSTVVAEVKGRAPAADATAIPLLLLAAKGRGEGEGRFSDVRHIQRLETVGGVAPASDCNATKLATVARVPYTATYFFYK